MTGSHLTKLIENINFETKAIKLCQISLIVINDKLPHNK